MNTELKSGINWVGYVDWNVRDFHSFNTAHGATYNSYLVQDEKVALIDTVKEPYASQLLCNVQKLVPLEKIDYVVCNHAEPDHGGAMAAVLKNLPNATLLCDAKCRDILAGYFDISHWKIQLVKSGDHISLGKRTLAFLETPMVHWPDSMFTYVPEEKLLFSMDAFGQHIATSVRFDDEWNLSDILVEAKAYYANIVAPYGKQVQKTMEAGSKLAIDTIAPSHGLIWRKNIPAIWNAYANWAANKTESKIVILYDSMWESTTRLADEVLAGINSVSQTINVQLLHARRNTLTRIATEMLDTAAVAFGSATLNSQMLPAMAAALTYIKGLKFATKPGFAFGSSGWGIGGTEQISKWFDEIQWEQINKFVSCRWRPNNESKAVCFEAGKLLAQRVLNR
ncbi:MAG: FprA family A-type flavoprotein [Planctomycetaceae bacterium]|jgi:flavorubredoxin|nr:FprA family A-type flavoprotein [Planctomycetaceae bacterium]